MSKNPAQLGNRRNYKTGKSKYKQGKFIPQNLDKYIGSIPILYRSSWEYAFCRFCDINEKVRKWSAEEIVINYEMLNNGKLEKHRYIPDFYLEMTGNDTETYDRVIVEIKPKHETKPPVPPKRPTLKMLENYEYSLKMYKKNLHSWSYAKEWCEKRHMKFIIINEDYLKKKGLI